ncbi:MAG: 16S rRNA (cytidine(1402)-2'-O)-methyltransferase [Methyloceanibacter sp.]
MSASIQDHGRRDHDASRRVLERAQNVLAEQMAQPLRPGLYLVATPIGNLGDISLRALAVLARADLIAAEDMRHSRKLLSHFGIKGELAPYHEHNAAKQRPRLLARIEAGFSVALISDAGTPLVSDPGYKLVREALDAGFTAISIPGPSAMMAGLISVGLPTDTFLFGGFLPPKAGPRRKRLEELKAVPATLVFFETASRLAKSLADMAEMLGSREAALAKELTKLHESVARGTLTDLAAAIEPSVDLRGEFVVVIGPPSPDEALIGDDAIVAELKQALEDQSFRDAVRSVAERFKLKRSRVYELGLALERPERDER